MHLGIYFFIYCVLNNLYDKLTGGCATSRQDATDFYINFENMYRT